MKATPRDTVPESDDTVKRRRAAPHSLTHEFRAGSEVEAHIPCTGCPIVQTGAQRNAAPLKKDRRWIEERNIFIGQTDTQFHTPGLPWVVPVWGPELGNALRLK